MELVFDHVIIGGGPAGMACAITLQKKNAKVLVIDKAVFPRHKTCGGLITKKTHLLIQELFEQRPEELEFLFRDSVTSVSLYDRTGLLVTAEVSDPMRFADRMVFDNALVQKYKELSGMILEGEKDYSIDRKNRAILLSGQRIVHYKNIIFADGALSQAQKQPGLAVKKLAFGIETFLSTDQFPLQGMSLHFDYGTDGYIWVFPYKDQICIGACSYYKGISEPKEMLRIFLEKYGINLKNLKCQGALAPYGYTVPQNKLPEDQFLLGDAAGFADPISGEGIYFALRSGIDAAKALLGPVPKKTYLNSIKSIVRTIHYGQKLKQYFFRPRIQGIFLRKVKNNPLFVRHFFDTMVADYCYGYNHMRRFMKDYRKQKPEKQIISRQS